MGRPISVTGFLEEIFALDNLMGFVDGVPGISELMGISGAISDAGYGDRWLWADHFVPFRLSDGFRHTSGHRFGAGLEHLKMFAMLPCICFQDLRLQINAVFVPRDDLRDCPFNAIAHMEHVADLDRRCGLGDNQKGDEAR